jgi:predicted SAM-dependent methyltransferase
MAAETTPLKLDLGCGPNKRPGFVGVDSRSFPGVDVVADLRQRWPWDDGSVEEVFCSHFVEHLTAPERIHFVNELYRVLRPGCAAELIVPNWASARAYGDLTHQWPPVSPHWFYYLNKTWRAQYAPHNDFYTCDFDTQYRYSLHERFHNIDQKEQDFACVFYVEAGQDIMARLVKR